MSSSESETYSHSSSSEVIYMTPCEKKYHERNMMKDKNAKAKYIESLNVDTYHLETCTISYKPRLIEVPSKDYPDIDSAVRKLERYHGGYVIHLKAGEHTLTERICDRVDILSIVGDCNPLAGVPFIQRCSIQAPELGLGIVVPPVLRQVRFCRGSECCLPGATAAGHYELRIGSRSIEVRGHGANPNFCNLCPGTRVGFFNRSGVISYANITRTSNNIINFDRNIPLQGTINNGESIVNGGEGFFIVPNVMLRIGLDESTIKSDILLKLVGLYIDSPNIFIIGPSGKTIIRRCVFAGDVIFQGQFDLDCPNIYLGTLLSWPGSSCTAYNQSFIGSNGHLEDLGKSGWIYSNFISCVHGVELKNGGISNFYGSEFINCCLALSASVGSVACIEACRFCRNLYATLATYGSVINSIPLSGTQETVEEAPWFIRNLITMLAYANSQIIAPNAQGYRNFIPFVIDGRVFTTIESNPVGTFYQFHSSIVILPNPLVPEPTELGCVDADSLPGNMDDIRAIDLTSADAIAVTSPSFIERITDDADIDISAQETIRRFLADQNGNGRRLRYFIEIS